MPDIDKFINPEDVDIGGKTFVISTIPCIPAHQIFMSAIGPLQQGRFEDIPRDTVLRLMSYVAVRLENGTAIPLSSEAWVNEHVSDLFTLISLEARMISRNFSFLSDGRLQRLLETAMGQAPSDTATSAPSSAS